MTETTTYPDLANRDEYREAALRCAARVMFLAKHGTAMPMGGPFEPTAEWLANETENLREVLQDGAVYANDGLRVYVLRLLGIAHSYQASSARAERGTA